MSDERTNTGAPPGASAAAREGGRPSVELATFALVSAEIAEAREPMAEVLRRHEIDDRSWTEASLTWLEAMAKDALDRGERATLAIDYARLFAEAQEALRVTPEVSPEDYAELVVAMQRGEGARALADRGLTQADFSRLVRRFAERFSTSPEENARYFERYLALLG